ncbi:GNAT family N-acetyltransferase [Oxalobacter vibrioformis]|uniref:GNAT family N-acetyltransferase n=1 Tax=Oxalobacter vibrioformis TaxID=933080 RepID=A0A9E9P376_9BURK|nr:GNAT family N-acetyltransferase [Oxalobacter vibrioformis]WAW10709.1 GNAT family N-acetyltransferase [Oxalobacter vibrioformis]
MKVVVREALLDDAQLIADLTRQAWAGKVDARSEGHTETETTVLPDLQHGGGFILMVDDNPAGCVRWLPTDEDGSIWKIHRLGVLPDYRGNSFSEHLLEAIIHHAHEYDISELHMALYPEHERLADFYAIFDFNIAPELEFSLRDSLTPPPVMLRKLFD